MNDEPLYNRAQMLASFMAGWLFKERFAVMHKVYTPDELQAIFETWFEAVKDEMNNPPPLVMINPGDEGKTIGQIIAEREPPTSIQQTMGRIKRMQQKGPALEIDYKFGSRFSSLEPREGERKQDRHHFEPVSLGHANTCAVCGKAKFDNVHIERPHDERGWKPD